MSFKVSIFTTITNPNDRGDNVADALKCYSELADEIVVVDGGVGHDTLIVHDPTRIRGVTNEWPKEFDWKLIGQQFQRGYEACTGDWVIHMDLDFIFHENDFEAIRQAFNRYSGEPALSFWKYQFILPDRYNIKSRLILAVNKGVYGDRIKFDGGGQQDLCQPSLDGKYLSPDDVPEARIPFYNYEKMTKTREQIADDSGRMERAYNRHFGRYQFKGSDGTDEKAFDGWHNMAVGRFHKPQRSIKLEEHPKYVQETIKNLRPDQWGYNGFELIEGRTYA